MLCSLKKEEMNGPEEKIWNISPFLDSEARDRISGSSAIRAESPW